MKEARDELNKLGLTDESLEKLWQHVNDEYFLRYSSDEIVWHTRAIITCSETALPLVMLRSQTRRGSAEIFIYAKNEGAIFSISTATLDQLGLTILDARIMTTDDDYALNSFQVLEQSGDPINEPYRIKHICNVLRNNIQNQEVKEHKNIHRLSRQAKHFPIPTKISFHPDSLNNQTIMELITTDHSGLLSKVGRVFNQQDISLHSARIITIGSRVEDMFSITDLQERPITDLVKQEQLREALIRVMDSSTPTQAARAIN
jgi:[protein-PII] uridylyltransferase